MKNTKRTSIITLVLLLSIFKVYSQYMFRHWDVVDGMSDNQIRYFTMAPDGRMVVRTASILTGTMVQLSNIWGAGGGGSINGISTGIKYLKIITMLTDGYG